MNSAHIFRATTNLLDIDEQRAAFEAALEKLSISDRLSIELLLAESGPLSGLGLGRTNKLELVAKVAMFCATRDRYRENGRE